MAAPMKRETLFLAIILLLFSRSAARDTITPASPLADGENLISAGGHFALGFFTPLGSKNRYVGVWFNKIPVQTVVWVANRNDPVAGPNATLSVSAAGGGLVMAEANRSAAVWSSATSGMQNPVAQLLDTGNLVLREANDGAASVWESFDYPTDTLIAGMKFGVDRRRGHRWNLTAWTSSSDPAAGQYYCSMDVGGDPEIFLWSGSKRIWRTGPWNGVRFSGVPDTKTYAGFVFDFVDSADEVSYSYTVTSPSILTRLVVNYTGFVQRYVWVETSNIWNKFWYTPRDQCDTISPCGPYGVCYPNRSPVCACVQGFTPRSPADWALRDGTDGCVRRTTLDCEGGTDGFELVGGAKVPDTSTATVDAAKGLGECRAACLGNCACTAYSSSNVSGGGSGCVMWTTELTDLRVFADAEAGQDLYVRLAGADLEATPGASHNSGHAGIIIAICVVLGALSLGCVGCFIWRRRRRRRKRELLVTTSATYRENDEGAEKNDLELPLFDFDTIATATNNFSAENKLGEGGFGPVYKGKLEDEQEIAVKRLAKRSMQGIDEFKTEVMLIAKLQHRNLVRLLGCCIQGGERMLIYEYMPNKSLDVLLFDKAKGALLDWQTRSKIIIGIARGLLYLHQDSRLRIIHRDLKASNILLDKEMNPKISDFGMARIFGGDVTEANTMRVVGTYGYMSPEYAMDGNFSVKSDVFSFGVLILEIISGKRNRGVHTSSPHLNLLGHAWSLWSEGRMLEIVDDSLGHSFPTDEVSRFIKVGLLSVQERPKDRPLISTLLFMLGGESSNSASLLQPKQPGFVARRVPLETEHSSSNQESSAFDDTYISIFEGR